MDKREAVSPVAVTHIMPWELTVTCLQASAIVVLVLVGNTALSVNNFTGETQEFTVKSVTVTHRDLRWSSVTELQGHVSAEREQQGNAVMSALAATLVFFHTASSVTRASSCGMMWCAR